MSNSDKFKLSFWNYLPIEGIVSLNGIVFTLNNRMAVLDFLLMLMRLDEVLSVVEITNN